MYTIGIYITSFFLKIIALFNDKIKLGIDGRKQTFKVLEGNLTPKDKTFWFHCASLGEYEQGLPVFEILRERHKTHKIVLSFFSPSGFEIRKNSPIADVVVYLPLDTKKNAKRFLDLVHPDLVIFVKYDFWPNFLTELKHRKHRAILISAAFRKNQPFFKWYGFKMREKLFAFEHIFVQNEQSKQLLSSINFLEVTVSGDTRFDRVSNQLQQNNTLDFVSEFKAGQLCIVIGSSWPEDEELLINFINSTSIKNVKYIFAPHNIKENQIKNLSSQLKLSTILYSEKEGKDLSNYNVFIIDTIGLLSKIYAAADIAYVGGAMGLTGLHNILEPAIFGIPIIIGKNYSKFPEASDMIKNGGVVSVKNNSELNNELENLLTSKKERGTLGDLNEAFITQNKGAVIQIANYIRI
ncbi:3-deoxy-D-manno-octulosonic-acid transferase [Ichthyenterobacterium magnum]|uniref:3-deoxy-D-manno-octulosonic acid transferase n=1 Tax=Ichthyenterobacterium magnum TaxID=1230530 RepID=A0A420DFF8_9FLAO|nr:glycosyltransferase N-terminal domain-containing protein [Ichthyenterobacterium magnum]RKE91912.1 3-deoxy-D-manno-octulosonic-acid transferase [Ichthyenterobacterium magnum]